jgi:hypothetical protein
MRRANLVGSFAALFVVAACGGKVSGDPLASIPSSAESEVGDKPPEPSGPEDGEWGTWQLLSLEGPDGRRQYDPPFVELDLHPDGRAYRWTCAASITGNGQRCPIGLRESCMVGRVVLSGFVWSVQLTNKEGTRVEARGDIVDEPSGDISVDGEGALHPRAHYRRVGAAGEGCIP